MSTLRFARCFIFSMKNDRPCSWLEGFLQALIFSRDSRNTFGLWVSMFADRILISCMCLPILALITNPFTRDPFLVLLRSKAVAEGNISFFLDNYVSARVSKLTYGTIKETRYNAADPEHVARKATAYPDSISGVLIIPRVFHVILAKVSLDFCSLH